MKRFLPILIIIIGFVSCDKINKPYKTEVISLECDTPSFPALNNVLQKYLLEDYTGHTCTNCPRAHAIAAGLKTQMGDTLVLIAIHSGSTARPLTATESCSFDSDFRTAAGNEYTEVFAIPGNPSGMINRTIFGTSRVLASGKWASTLEGITRTPATMGIQIIPEYNNDKACVFVKASLLSDNSKQLRLCVLLTENGIIAPQKDATAGDICNYEHNHMLRASLAPTWGDNLNIAVNGDSQIKGYSVSFNGQPWNKENCHIIAFIYDVDTQEILQVEEVKLVQ